MFVEQLSIEELINYIIDYDLPQYDEHVRHQYDFDAIADYKVSDGSVTFRIDDMIFNFTDFDYATNYTRDLRYGLHNEKWLNFMTRKFGKTYTSAFLNFRKKEKEILLKVTAKNFDNNTINYAKKMCENNAESNSTCYNVGKDLESTSCEDSEEALQEHSFDL
ncbi:MAG: hypothetical protein ACI4L7_01280 [Christensenellales bacterium]